MATSKIRKWNTQTKKYEYVTAKVLQNSSVQQNLAEPEKTTGARVGAAIGGTPIGTAFVGAKVKAVNKVQQDVDNIFMPIAKKSTVVDNEAKLPGAVKYNAPKAASVKPVQTDPIVQYSNYIKKMADAKMPTVAPKAVDTESVLNKIKNSSPSAAMNGMMDQTTKQAEKPKTANEIRRSIVLGHVAESNLLQGSKATDFAKYALMTDDEANQYASLTGERQANYLKSLDKMLSTRVADKTIENVNGIQNKAAKNIATTAVAYGGGYDEGMRGLEQIGRGIAGQTDPVKSSSLSNANAEIAPTLTGGAKVASDIAGSFGQMTPAIVAGLATGGGSFIGNAVGAGITGLASGGTDYAEAKEDGYTTEQARLFGITDGILQGGLNLALGAIPGISGGGVISKSLTKALAGNPTVVKTLATLAAKFGDEAVEEYVQTIGTDVLRNIVLGEDKDIKLNDPNYLYAALLGGFIGFGSNLPGEVGSLVKTKTGTIQTATAPLKTAADASVKAATGAPVIASIIGEEKVNAIVAKAPVNEKVDVPAVSGNETIAEQDTVAPVNDSAEKYPEISNIVTPEVLDGARTKAGAMQTGAAVQEGTAGIFTNSIEESTMGGQTKDIEGLAEIDVRNFGNADIKNSGFPESIAGIDTVNQSEILREFANYELDKDTKDRINTGKPPERLIKDVANYDDGADISNFDHYIFADGIRHGSKHNKDTGNIPIIPDDVARIPELLSSYDDITITKKRGGETSIKLIKNINGEITYIMTLGKKKGWLFTKNMWKIVSQEINNGSSRRTDTEAPALTPEAAAYVEPYNSNISQFDDVVKKRIVGKSFKNKRSMQQTE